MAASRVTKLTTWLSLLSFTCVTKVRGYHRNISSGNSRAVRSPKWKHFSLIRNIITIFGVYSKIVGNLSWRTRVLSDRNLAKHWWFVPEKLASIFFEGRKFLRQTKFFEQKTIAMANEQLWRISISCCHPWTALQYSLNLEKSIWHDYGHIK